MQLTDYRPFGRTGVKISPLVLGCMMFGGRTDLEDSCRIIDRALDGGINILDTANVYSRGGSEEFVGEALKRNGHRHKVMVCTKGSHAMDDVDPNMQGNSRRHIIAQCELSLKRLGTDYIDLYQIHRAQPDVAIDETLRALDDLVRSGKVRYVGASNFAGWQMVESLWAAKELGLNRFVSEQSPYNLLDRRLERELIPVAQTYDIAVIPWGPVASGMLTGKYKRGQPLPGDSRFANPLSLTPPSERKAPSAPPKDVKPHPIYAARLVDTAFDAIDALLALAKEKGVAPSQFALAWVAAQPGVTAPIIGPRTMEQLEDALAALSVTFTPEDFARIDQIVPPGTHASAFYLLSPGPTRRW